MTVLQNTWDQAYERMYSAITKDRIDLILNITALNDIDYLKKYLLTHGNELKPEEKYFIEMSIRLKKYPESKKDSRVEEYNSLNNSISDEDFQNFVSMNFISKHNLEIIARKIIENSMLSPRELAIYSEKSNDIEGLLKLKFNNN
ncbi:MAG: hypothetical protein IPG12_10650 [Saprospiraceae bacterium]|nr:hypothetical protein [Saprospiraceae bacterium]